MKVESRSAIDLVQADQADREESEVLAHHITLEIVAVIVVVITVMVALVTDPVKDSVAHLEPMEILLFKVHIMEEMQIVVRQTLIGEVSMQIEAMM